MRKLLLGIALALTSLSAQAQSVSTTTTAAGSNVVVSGQHVFFGFHATVTAPLYVMLFDAASDPADGSVIPKGCFYVTPQTTPAATTAMANTPAALIFVNGIVVVTSSTGCFTKTETGTSGYLSVIWQ